MAARTVVLPALLLSHTIVASAAASASVDNTSIYEATRRHHDQLQSQMETKLQGLDNVRTLLEGEVAALKRLLDDDDDGASVEKLYQSMDDSSLKLMNLISRTNALMEKVGSYNRLALSEGGVASAGASSSGVVGLVERLDSLYMEELDRRDRFGEWKDNLVADAADGEDGASDATKSTSSPTTATESPYITLSKLQSLLNPQTILQPSESTLQSSLLNYTKQSIISHTQSEYTKMNDHLSYIHSKYEDQIKAFQMELKHQQLNSECIAIPRAVELVGQELHRYYGGSVDEELVMDYASFENGGSVVYGLTSGVYRPGVRNDDVAVGGSSGGGRTEEGGIDPRAIYERSKDKTIEAMYHRQRDLMKSSAGESGNLSWKDQVYQMMERIDVWEWYTSYKFGSLRQYLPEDWERALDWMSDRLLQQSGSASGGGSWDEYTPRGTIDALIPDYVYHSLGISNSELFGTVFGRTASPEVAITSGTSKSGDNGSSSGNSSIKPLGNCYPLSMHSDDDPALAYISRHAHMEGGMQVMDDTSLLIGPKYTVRLSQPIYIDAVTLEHHSFPLPKAAVGEYEGKKGGESAPRYVRVVGFPPCLDTGTDGDDECSARGFEIASPIDLGSFEYQRIAVSGREDDYGGVGEDEGSNTAATLNRRRSIQSFAVNGGKWKPSAPIPDEASSVESSDEAGEEQGECTLESLSCAAKPDTKPKPAEDTRMGMGMGAGQCTPNYDDTETIPSCGGDGNTESTPPSVESSRQTVAAVSFIIEENWGNDDYTCLYRVRVHGDAVEDDSLL